ncbi:hypothetical protein [Methanoregula sp.]|uniref:hypothetical protein n=1 Tax=Methanoregula sp. TaxID=2052170 RepID=UPI00260B5EAD|nr:hypothetical protein [Methanoregula sp.]MDD5144068.1 hypothetical protein [Methanoregula sp.]
MRRQFLLCERDTARADRIKWVLPDIHEECGRRKFRDLRLRSGSIWTASLLHGFWNYFIQQFYPAFTATTGAGSAMLGEFGWCVLLISIVIGLLCWHLRYMLPKMPKPEGGL